MALAAEMSLNVEQYGVCTSNLLPRKTAKSSGSGLSGRIAGSYHDDVLVAAERGFAGPSAIINTRPKQPILIWQV
jgi:hypothetical protein